MIALGLLMGIGEAQARKKSFLSKPLKVFEGPLDSIKDLSPATLVERYKSNPKELLDVCQSSFALAQTARATAIKGRSDLLNQSSVVASIPKRVVLYSARSPASLTYNVKAGTYGYVVTLPNGVEVDKGRLKSSSSGKYSVPTGNPKQITKRTGYVETKLVKGYDDWVIEVKAKAKPNRHVYLASKRFVDFFSDQKAAQEVGFAILSQGRTADGSVATWKEQLALEWADILNWFRQIEASDDKSDEAARDIKNAEAARDVVEEIFELAEKAKFDPTKLGRIIKATQKWKDYELDVDIDLTDYEHVTILPISSTVERIKGILSLIGYEPKPVSKRSKEKHLAFLISIKRHKEHKPDLRNFISLLQKGATDSVGLLGDKVSGGGQIKLGDSVRLFAKDGGDIRSAFAEALSKAGNENGGRYKGDGVFDFTDSNAASWLEDRLRNFAVGNDGDAEVKRLVVDVASSSISVDFDLVHRHSLTKEEILKELEAKWDNADKGFNNILEAQRDECKKFKEHCKKLTAAINHPSELCAHTFEVKPLEPSNNPFATSRSESERPISRWRPIEVCPNQNVRSSGLFDLADYEYSLPVHFALYPWPPKQPHAPPLTLAESVKLHLGSQLEIGTELDKRRRYYLRRGVAIRVPTVVEGKFDVVTEELKLRRCEALRTNMEILLRQEEVFGLRFTYESTTDVPDRFRDIDHLAPAAESQFLSLAMSAIITTAGLSNAKIVKVNNDAGQDIILILRSNDRALVYTRRIANAGRIANTTLFLPRVASIYKVVETLYYGKAR